MIACGCCLACTTSGGTVCERQPAVPHAAGFDCPECIRTGCGPEHHEDRLVIQSLRDALGTVVAALGEDHHGKERGECGACDAYADGMAALEATKDLP